MAKNITIKVPGKHPQTGELTTLSSFMGEGSAPRTLTSRVTTA